MSAIDFTIHEHGRPPEAAAVAVETVIIAGWTGRDHVAVEHHIRELEALGVARPSTTPVFYRVAARRITTAARIEVAGPDSSGEVEYFVLRHGGRLYVGVGSDHTDRKAETYDVTVSKQMCDKPVGCDLWPFDEVEAHWDRLVTRSWTIERGERSLYQEGALAAMLPPRELMVRLSGGDFPEGALMFGGTHATRGGIRPAPRFEIELADPVLGRSIRHAYDIVSLPIVR